MKQFQTLLLAVDVTEHNKEYLEKAIIFIKSVKAAVTLLYVKEKLPVYSYFTGSQVLEDPSSDLENIKNYLTEEDIEVQGIIIKEGRPYKIICETAESLSVSAIIINAGTTYPSIKSIGSNADKCMRMAGCHTVLINSHLKHRKNSVVCAFDFSETSIKCLSSAVALAEVLNAELHIVHVVNEVYFSSSVPIGGNKSLLKDHHIRKQKAVIAADAALTEAVSKVTNIDNEKVNLHIRQGIPENEIISFLSEDKSRWLVIGRSGHRSFIELFIGSTAEKTIRACRSNTIIVT